jgi:hypothetical protein
MEVALKREEERKDKFKGIMVAYVRKNIGGHFSKKGKEIIKPIRARKGVMVALPVDDERIRIGWSLCNFSMGDTFGDLGPNIAIERAETGSTVVPADSMIKPLEKFIERAKRYYKDRKVEVTFPKSVWYDEGEGMDIATAF